MHISEKAHRSIDKPPEQHSFTISILKIKKDKHLIRRCEHDVAFLILNSSFAHYSCRNCLDGTETVAELRK